MSENAYRRRRHGRRLKTSGLRVVLLDAALFIVAINVFALFHHVLPVKLTPAGSKSALAAATETYASVEPTPAQAAAAETPAETPMPTPVPGDFSASFPADDTGAGALYSYQTDTVRIAIERISENNVTYFLADVYIRNIDALQTAFAKGTYGKSVYEFPTKTAVANGAVFAVTGDYYSARSKGVVVRNGLLYRDVPSSDVCVLYRSGEMQTFTGETPDLTAFDTLGIWQAWSFGPALLSADGKAISEFTSDLNDRHPRCGIGYYAPGHYCFIVVDGRQKGYSVGVRLPEFAAMFEKLGCMQAYNLDGGATAIMMFRGEVINQPYKGGRESGDIIYFQ